jgi:predicted ATPase
MQLRKIALTNFKCFEKVNLECSKFTLLTGANSSGKSSLIYSLLGALQTTNFPFYFSPNGRYANMGDFVDIALNHRKSNAIGINLEFLDETAKDSRLVLDGTFNLNRATGLPRLASLNFESPSLDLGVRKNGLYKGHYHFPTCDNLKSSVR